MKTHLLALSALALRLLAKLPFVHEVRPSELFPHRGLLIEREHGNLGRLHIVLGLHWGGRMHWSRLSFEPAVLFQHRIVYGWYKTFPEAPDWMEYDRFGPTGRKFGHPLESFRWEFVSGNCDARTGECLVEERWAEIDSL